MAEMITVACRLPHGLHLDNFRGEMNPENRVRVTLNGANKSQIIGGCGTTAVARDHWDEWMKRNANAPFLKNGSVWVAKNQSDSMAEGQSRASEKTGFEGADPREVDRRLKALEH
jgi:hypothetical protein